LLSGEESSVVKNSEHIFFVVLHLGKKAALSVAQTSFISSSVGRDIELRRPGAYGVRYLFVICGFSLAETENPEARFSWVEPLKPTIWNLFDIGAKLTSDR
jgi:hypothetical protein